MFTTVSIQYNPLNAYIVYGRLVAEGIPARLLYDQHIWANLWISLALGGIRIDVWHTQQTAAANILSKLAAGEFELTDSDMAISDIPHCPKCGATDAVRHDWLPNLSLVALVLAHIPIPFSRFLYSCTSCKKSWIAREQRTCPPATVLLASLIVYALILLAFFIPIALFETRS